MNKVTRAPLVLFLFWLALYTLTASGRITPGDEETMFEATERLATHGTLDIGRETVAVEPMADERGLLLPRQPTILSTAIETTSAAPGVGGRRYSKYGLGQSVAALPLWLAGRGLSWVVPEAGTAYAERFAASFLNAVATAFAAWLVADAGLALGYRPRTAIALSACYGLTTMAWPFAKNWFSEPAVTALLLLAFDAGSRARKAAGRREAWLSGASLAAAVLFRITSLFWAPAFALFVLWPGAGRRRVRLVALLVPVVLAVALTGAYNAVRFGSPLSFGYPEAQWDSSPVGGLMGLLGSPGKGLFLYNPPLLLGVAGLVLWMSAAGGRRAEGATVLALAVITLAYIAPYHFWTGGWNWGPRFLLPLVPLLLLPAGALLEAAATRLVRVLWIGLCILGLIVNLPAVLVDHSRYLVAASERGLDNLPPVWLPEQSPVLWQWPMVGEVWTIWSEEQATLARGARHFPGDPPGVAAREEYLRWNAPDFWQAHWWLLGLPMWLPGVVSGACLVGLCAAAYRLRSTIIGEAAGRGKPPQSG